MGSTPSPEITAGDAGIMIERPAGRHCGGGDQRVPGTGSAMLAAAVFALPPARRTRIRTKAIADDEGHHHHLGEDRTDACKSPSALLPERLREAVTGAFIAQTLVKDMGTLPLHVAGDLDEPAAGGGEALFRLGDSAAPMPWPRSPSATTIIEIRPTGRGRWRTSIIWW